MLGRFAFTLTLCIMAAPAFAQTTIKFTLGWKTQGSDAFLFVARDKGYFKDEGLDVVIDQGEGSGATITRIMSGAYDAGFGDMNAIIQNASSRKGEAPVMVYQAWNRPPFAIVSKASAGIRSPKDLEGKALGGSQGTPTVRMLPVFAKANQLDENKLKLVNMAPNLQEPLLVKGEIDAALIFNITSYFNLILNRQDPEKDYAWMPFGDHGLDLYSNGVMVSPKLLRENPKAVGGLVRAINKAMMEVAQDQDLGMKAILKFDNLVNEAVEKRRLQYSFEKLIVSPELTEIGVGDLKDDRLKRAIGMVADGYGLTRRPEPSEVFDRSFLPPKVERALVYTKN